MLDVVLDALKDSAITLAVVFFIYFLLSFFETWISEKLEHSSKLSPLLGATFGLIPQCGLSVVASDLYLKERITMGTLIAVFISCSDEALPIILSSPTKAIMVLPLILIKFVLGFLVGFTVDLLIRPKDKSEETEEPLDKVHIGCCGHEIDNEEESKWHKHLFHPLLHSLKIFAYVFGVNLIFGLILYYVGQDRITSFLEANKYLTPLYSTLIGMIPNCASSVIISEMFINGDLSFGAALAGLIVNAGLGMVILLKDRKAIKKTMTIFGILSLVSLVSGYITCLILGF